MCYSIWFCILLLYLLLLLFFSAILSCFISYVCIRWTECSSVVVLFHSAVFIPSFGYSFVFPCLYRPPPPPLSLSFSISFCTSHFIKFPQLRYHAHFARFTPFHLIFFYYGIILFCCCCCSFRCCSKAIHVFSFSMCICCVVYDFDSSTILLLFLSMHLFRCRCSWSCYCCLFRSSLYLIALVVVAIMFVHLPSFAHSIYRIAFHI